MQDFLVKCTKPTKAEIILDQIFSCKLDEDITNNDNSQKINKLYDLLDEVIEKDPSLLLKYSNGTTLVEYAYINKDLKLFDILLKHDHKNKNSISQIIINHTDTHLINHAIEAMEEEFVIKLLNTNKINKLKLSREGKCGFLTLALLNPEIKNHQKFKNSFQFKENGLFQLRESLIYEAFLNSTYPKNHLLKIEEKLGKNFIPYLPINIIQKLAPISAIFKEQTQQILPLLDLYDRFFLLITQGKKQDIAEITYLIDILPYTDTIIRKNYSNRDFFYINIMHPTVEEEIKKLLLRKIKDPCAAITSSGWSALHIAAQLSYDEIIREWLIEGKIKDINICIDGLTSLDLALNNKQKSLSTILTLLENGAVCAKESLKTLLNSDDFLAKDEDVQLLLEKFPNPCMILNKKGLTPLHLAAGKGYNEVIRKWYKEGKIIDINIQKKSDGWTALHIATHYNKVDVVAELIEAGIDTSIRDNYGQTALALKSSSKAINLILVNEAKDPYEDINAKGLTPIEIAENEKFLSIIGKWLKHSKLNQRDTEKFKRKFAIFGQQEEQICSYY